MDNERKASPIAFRCTVMGWMLVVYVLLLGPIDGLQSAGRFSEPIASGIRWLYAPLSWAIAHSPEPVHQAFFAYVHFWVELLKR